MVIKRSVPSPVAALPTETRVALPSNNGNSNNDDIITLPISKKPRIGFKPPGEFNGIINPDNLLAGATDLRNRLASFLPSLKAADEQLEKEKLAGRIAERRIEIESDDSESGSSISDSDSDSESVEFASDGDDSGRDGDGGENEESVPIVKPIAEVLISSLLNQPDEEGAAATGGGSASTDDVSELDGSQSTSKPHRKKKKNKQPYIEMNLGLGVLEELKPSRDTDGDKELDERRELVSRILELRRLQQEEVDRDDEIDSGDEGVEKKLVIPEEGKKVVIEELE
ncbi:hypothetical protein AA313_de0206955 [Arthrobotrys entomopaga]|nr:hypothetical protein AA313_de0206955 [Arthrobotrys entomopaga]